MKNLLSLASVKAKTSRSRSAIYLAIKQGTFPKPIRIGARRIAFLEDEIDAWIASKIAASRATNYSS